MYTGRKWHFDYRTVKAPAKKKEDHFLIVITIPEYLQMAKKLNLLWKMFDLSSSAGARGKVTEMPFSAAVHWTQNQSFILCFIFRVFFVSEII